MAEPDHSLLARHPEPGDRQGRPRARRSGNCPSASSARSTPRRCAAGATETDAYLADWRRGDPAPCGDDLEAEASAAAARLEADYDDDRLARLATPGRARVNAAARRLHAVRQARRLRRRDEPARGRAPARRRSRFRLRRARHLRPLPGRDRRGRVRQARARSARRSRDALERGRAALRRKARRRCRRPAARLPGADLRRPRRRRAAGKPGPPPGRAQARGDASDRDRPGRAAALRRGRASRTCATPSSDFRRLQEALAEQWGLAEATADLAVLRDAAEDAARRRLDGDRRAARGPRHRRDHARAFADRALRRRVRHRLDHDRRPSLRPLDRRGARLGGRDEPADPLRRGSDEPGLLRHDESGRRRRADDARARGRSTR